MRPLRAVLLAPLALAACAAALLCAPAPAAAAEFGFLPGAEGFSAAATQQNGSPATEAGTHPYQLTAVVNFTEGPESPGQPGVPFPAADLRDMRFELPSGLIGNPTRRHPLHPGPVQHAALLALRSEPLGRELPRQVPGRHRHDPHRPAGGGDPHLRPLQPHPAARASAPMLGAAPFGAPLAFAGQVRNVRRRIRPRPRGAELPPGPGDRRRQGRPSGARPGRPPTTANGATA